jgi:DNA mismatch repair protein MSH2
LDRVASPGKLTAFEDELFRNSENTEPCVIMAITLSKSDNIKTLGVAYCNISAGQLGACQFADNEQFSILESIILQLGAKEIVMQKVFHRSRKLILL